MIESLKIPPGRHYQSLCCSTSSSSCSGLHWWRRHCHWWLAPPWWTPWLGCLPLPLGPNGWLDFSWEAAKGKWRCRSDLDRAERPLDGRHATSKWPHWAVAEDEVAWAQAEAGNPQKIHQRRWRSPWTLGKEWWIARCEGCSTSQWQLLLRRFATSCQWCQDARCLGSLEWCKDSGRCSLPWKSRRRCPSHAGWGPLQCPQPLRLNLLDS